VVEYHLDCAGIDNYWMNCRWENTGTGARVLWRANSVGNVIAYGSFSHMIVEHKESGTGNILLTRSRNRMIGDGSGGVTGQAVLSLENTYSSAAPALRVMAAGAQSSSADQSTDWAVEVSAQRTRGKRSTDKAERIGLDHLNGRVYLGSGTAAPTRYLGMLGESMAFDGASVAFVADNRYDLGTSGRRPRYVRAGTGIQTGAFTKASRPTPAAAGIGTCIFDATLKKPIWSTGVAWVDATGTPV
jgi:hypothetical protein